MGHRRNSEHGRLRRCDRRRHGRQHDSRQRPSRLARRDNHAALSERQTPGREGDIELDKDGDAIYAGSDSAHRGGGASPARGALTGASGEPTPDPRRAIRGIAAVRKRADRGSGLVRSLRRDLCGRLSDVDGMPDLGRRRPQQRLRAGGSVRTRCGMHRPGQALPSALNSERR